MSSLDELHIDFVAGREYTYPLRGKNELLAKAIGLHLGIQTVADLTAGLGEDAWTMARLGFRVEASEANQELAQLLHAAHQVAAASEQKVQSTAHRIQFLHALASERLRQFGERPAKDRPEVIYLDPMFPDLGKSALPKKRMQILRGLELVSEDLEVLLQQAFQCAQRRVVLKRSLKDPTVWKKPSLQVKGKSVRYDVYFARPD